MRRLGLRQMVTAYHSPLQNVYAERVIGTIRRECLDHVIVLGEDHARRILDELCATTTRNGRTKRSAETHRCRAPTNALRPGR